MHRSWLIAVLASLALATGCGGSGTKTPTDGPLQSDGAIGDANNQQDGSHQNDGPPQSDGALQNDAGMVSHTENNGGVMHAPGKDNPLVNCTACHGADLTGGTGPSCRSCHNNADHTVNRGGHMHRSGASSTCNACHGPGNTGGLGPSCNGAGCH